MYVYIKNIDDVLYLVESDGTGKRTTKKLKIYEQFKPEYYLPTSSKTPFRGFITDAFLEKRYIKNKKELNELNRKPNVYGLASGDPIINQYKTANPSEFKYDLKPMIIDIETVNRKNIFASPEEVKFPIHIITVAYEDRNFLLFFKDKSILNSGFERFSRIKMFWLIYPEYEGMNLGQINKTLQEEYSTCNDYIKDKSDKYKKIKTSLETGEKITDIQKTIKTRYEKIIDNEKEIVNKITFLNMCLRCECKYYNTEKELIIGFADLVKELKPDVITGFYNVFFDFPYIFKRTEKLFGNLNIFKEVSPFKMLEKVKIQDDREKVINSYEIVGVPIIDYRSLYYRFTQKRLGSYSLANILIAEKIFLKKVEKDMGFFEAYTEHTQMFCTYSLVDVLALKLLINKTNYIFSYYFYMERFSISAEQYNKPVVFWDNRYYQFLKDKNIIIPPHTKQEEYERIEGAYNKEPIKNKVGYSVVCDVKSLYPMLMILFNISPETYVSNDFIKDKKLLEYSRKASQKISTDKADIDYSKGIDMYLNNEIDAKYIASKGLIMAPNGAFFDVREKGMIPQLMQIDFSARQEKAKKAEESYQKAKVTHNQEEANQLMIEYANNEGLQYNIKISINSCYGTLLSIYNRYFNPACGGAITSGGHLCIRYIIAETNKMINKHLNTKDEDYVIASSTDSMYVDLDLYYDKFYKGDRTNKFEIVLFLNEFCKNILAPFLAKSFDILERRLGSKEKVLRMPIEAILDSGVWLDKRNYVIRPVSDDKNLFYEKPKLKIKGNTLVSSSYPKFALKNIESIFIQILDGVDGKTIKQNMEKLKKEYVKLPLKDVAINISLSSLDNYMVEEDNLSGNTVQIAEKGTPQHSKGAINFNNLIDKYDLDENLKLTSGNKVCMLLLKYDNPLGIDEICFSDKLPKEFGIEPFVDYDRMFSRVFENIICNKILEPLAMNVNVDALWG